MFTEDDPPKGPVNETPVELEHILREPVKFLDTAEFWFPRLSSSQKRELFIEIENRYNEEKSLPASERNNIFIEQYEGFLEAYKLKPDSWFIPTKNGPKFVPHLCASDYLRVYRHVITEYVGSGGEPSQFMGTHWIRNASGIIGTELENTGKASPREIKTAIESIANHTRITDPDQIGISLESSMHLPENVIPLKHGLFNLIEKRLIPHNPDYFYTELLPRRYIKGGTPEAFIWLLNQIFLGDPDVEKKKVQIFETIAWTLMNDYRIHGAVIFYGQGGEGKSIIHSIFRLLLGKTSSITLRELESDKFKRAELTGKWANLVSESTTEIITSEWFKRVTDGTEITVDRKNGQPYVMSSHAKMIIDTNELPAKENERNAFYRRIIVIIDFPHTLESVLKPNEIDKAVSRLQEPDELDRIFSYTVDRFFNSLVTRMKFTGHLDISDAELKWEERSNPSSSFLKMKDAESAILTDISEARSAIEARGLDIKRFISREKPDSTEYLTTPKNDVILEAVNWAKERGFPAKSINSGLIGKALISLGYPNVTVNKKLGKSTPVKAWRDVFILPGNGSKDGHENSPIPQDVRSHIGSERHSSGSLSYLQPKDNDQKREACSSNNVTLSDFSLENWEENAVTVNKSELLLKNGEMDSAYMEVERLLINSSQYVYPVSRRFRTVGELHEMTANPVITASSIYENLEKGVILGRVVKEGKKYGFKHLLEEDQK